MASNDEINPNNDSSAISESKVPSVSVDEVRKLVAEEGRSARNLLIWNVPLEENELPDGTLGKIKRPPTSPRLTSSKLSFFEGTRRGSKRSLASVGKSRIRSASAGRDPKLDFKSRYWTFLFENLRRAVDEIHETCETDNSIVECKEAIMVLENYTKDFHSLIEWINLKRDFDSTPARNRPTSLAWGMRRPSSRSNLFISTFDLINKPTAQRSLKFESCSEASSHSPPQCASQGVQTDPVECIVSEKTQPACSSTQESTKSTLKVNPKLKQASLVTTQLKDVTQGTIDKTAQRNLPQSTAQGVSGGGNKVMSPASHSPESGLKLKVGQNCVTKLLTKAKCPAAAISKTGLLLTSSINKVSHTTVITRPTAAATRIVPSASVAKTSPEKPTVCKAEPKNGSTSSLSSTSSSSQSWADKVRGKLPSTPANVSNMQLTPEEEVKNDVSKQDEDSEGWETVQRVRSKCRASPPYKNQKFIAGNARSNSISGFEMYSEKAHQKLLQTSRSKVSPQSENKLAARPDSFQLAAVVPAKNKKDQPKPAKSLPSLHIKSLESGFSSSQTSPKHTAGNGKKEENQNPSKDSPRNSSGAQKLLDKSAKLDDKKKAMFSVSKSGTPPVKCQNIASGNVPKKQQPLKEKLLSNTVNESENSDELNDSQDSLHAELLAELAIVSEDEGSVQSLPLCEDDDGNQSEATTTEDEATLSGRLTPMWGDCIDNADLRAPGRVLQIHEKLSSPSRKRPLSESKRRHEEKQAKAQEQRVKLLEEKAQRWKEITKKLEESRQRKEDVMQQRKQTMEAKLQRAEEKRRAQLQKIVRKAHDEEEKVNEIAFINSLEAQNKRHDVMSRIQGHEARLQDIQEERQRRQEEKAAKEAAVEERRRAIEAERQAKLKVMQERRQEKEQKIEQHQQEREKERQEMAREKARDREERMSALQAAQQANVEELQKKIQHKQEESARRHEENIEHIRQKALELSIQRISSTSDDAPRLVPYETKKLCTLCNVLIGSEVYLLSHLRGKKHQQAIQEHHDGRNPSREEMESYNLKHIMDAPADKIDPLIALDKERQKALKKRCKKIRHRMATKGAEFENLPSSKLASVESEHKLKLQKCVRDVGRCFQQPISGPWPTNLITVLDRTLGETTRLLERKGQTATSKRNDQLSLRFFGGVPALTQILNVILASTQELNPVIPARTLVNACHLYRLICESNKETCQYLLASNRLTGLLDLLIHRLNLLVPDNCSHLFMGTGGNIITSLPVDNVAKALMKLIATILSNLNEEEVTPANGKASKGPAGQTSQSDLMADSVYSWIQDIISYTVSVGIVDKLSQYYSNVRGPIDSEPLVAEFLQQGMAFLLALTKLLSHRHHDIFEKARVISEDNTQLVATLRITDVVGTVSLLYGMLLHSGAPSRGHTPPPQLTQGTLAVIFSSLYMLNHFALLDLHSFQSVVGAEGISLEFRHIVSYLLWYCNHWPNDRLLHEIILSIDYFAVCNQENQIIIQSGHQPTVLQQLCLLPFQYFSDPTLVDVLFPTLISCCYKNTENSVILEQEMSCELLAHFLEEKSLDLSSESTKRSKDKAETASVANDWRWCLESRFPRCKWDEAQEYFRSH